MKRKLIYLILALFVVTAAGAQDVSLRSDHPDEYIVVEGDTLWDISGKFLDHPWQWPTIWHANQQIENPHLIYPGDLISLVYVDGQPRLVVDRGRPTVRLSPEKRSTSREPIPPIPFDDLQGFLRNIRMVSQEEFDSLPYIVATNEGRYNAAHLDKVYARGVEGSVGEFFSVMRLGSIYYRTKKGEIKRAIEPGYGMHAPTDVEWHPTWWESAANSGGNRGEVIGFELYQVAEVMVNKTGDPAILEVGTSFDSVKEGDFVLPLDTIGYVDPFMPRAMDTVPDGLKVIAVQGDNNYVGHLKMVAMTGGAKQGVQPGHVFSAFRPGVTIRDSVKYPAGSLADAGTWKGDKVTLPDEFDAHIMVVRVFDEISYALIMTGDRPVVEHDVLKHPDDTL